MTQIWRRYRFTSNGRWMTEQMANGDSCSLCVLTDLHWHRLRQTGEVSVVLVVDEDPEKSGGPGT